MSPTAIGVGGNAYSGATAAGGDSRATATGVGGNQHQGQGQSLDNRNTVSARTGASTSGASTGAVTTGAVTTTTPQTQTYAPTTIIKHADIPVPTAYTAPVIAAQATGCQISQGGFGIGAQLPGAGATVTLNRGTTYNEESQECDNRLRDHSMIRSGKAPLECLGVLTAAQRDPALAKALAIAEGAGQLNASFCQALAGPPVMVTVVDNAQQAAAAAPASKNPCANGATPVWNAGKSDFECRKGEYNLK